MPKKTVSVFVSKRDPLFEPLFDQSLCVTRLSNRSNFLIRQIMTGVRKTAAKRFPNEKEALNLIGKALPFVNAIRRRTFKSKVSSGKNVEKPKLFEFPTREHWYLGLDLKQILQVLDDPDYRSLQSNLAQRVVQTVCNNWTSYFDALRDWKFSPDKYKAKPKIPGYRKKESPSTIIYTNQNCRFVRSDGKKKEKNAKEEKVFLSFPRMKERLEVTDLLKKYPIDQYKLCEVKAVPKPTGFEIQITYDDKTVPPSPSTEEPERIAAIDIGLINFASISNNVGAQPLIIKGNVMKCRNQWYNKKISGYKSEAMKSNNMYSTKRIKTLWYDRDKFLDNMYGLIANALIRYFQENKIDTVVCGLDQNIKQKSGMGPKNNQNFQYIAYAEFLSILAFKCRLVGIRFIRREESYTSKASFLDRDPIPTYSEGNKKSYTFSGRRIKRGLYRASDGRLINADINGASNILRKEFPLAFQNVSDFKYLMNPKVYAIHLDHGKVRIA